MMGVALVMKEMGELDAAIEKYGQVVRIQEATLGCDHPQVAMTLGNISNVYQAQGKFPEALETSKKVLNIFEKIHGHMHPVVATTQVLRI
jgi:tetratricopeptide (TPR) repeat protein